MEFNEETMAQVVHIQLDSIIKYCTDILTEGVILPKDVKKVQKIFDIINDKKEEKLKKVDIIL